MWLSAVEARGDSLTLAFCNGLKNIAFPWITSQEQAWEDWSAVYAMGMAPEQLRELTTHIDWTDLFRPVPAYDWLSYRRKEDRREYPNHLELGLRGGLKVPPGLNSGHSIGILLDRLTLPYSQVSNFDDLPIPFRCLATDMVEAKQIVLDHGPLAVALQATMAIPGVFAPVEVDGKILVSDGGLLKNIPTDVVEQMGADVVIAVDIGTPLAKREALDSLGGILGQTIGVMMEESTRRSLDPRLHPNLKIVLSPELKKFTTFDFTAVKEITDLGYQGAEAKASELLQYALTEQEWQRHLEERRSRMRKTVPIPEFVQVTGVAADAEKAIRGRLQENAGTPIDTSLLATDLDQIWGEGRYAGLSYGLTEQEGKSGLLVHVRDKKYAPPILNLGLELNNTETDIFDFNLRARVTMMDVFSHGSEWRVDGSLGSRILAGTEYYKLLGPTHFFVAPYAFYERTKLGLFFGEEQVAQYQIDDKQLGADIGYTFEPTSEVRFGYAIGHLDASRTIGDPLLPEVSGKTSVLRTQWILDAVDSPVVATHGARASLVARWIFDSPTLEGSLTDSSFAQIHGRLTQFLPVGKKNTLVFTGEVGHSFSDNIAPFEAFTLGGLFHVSGLGRDELRGDNLLYGGITYLRKIAQMPPLLGEKVSAGIWYEIGSVYNDEDEKDAVQSISAGVIAETFLGPIFLGGSYGEGGHINSYFAIGRFF